MATLSWDEIVERGKQHNKTVICEVEKRGSVRYFKVKCNLCGFETIQILGRNSCKGCLKSRKKISTTEFNQKSTNVHGDLYDYDFVEYIDSKTKVKIFCKKCNKIFEQMPKNHLMGHGCKSCAIKHTNCVIKKLSKQEFCEKAFLKHGDLYNYDLVEYVNNKIKVKILCNQCNRIFEQTPLGHLRGRGCITCKQSKGELRVKKYLTYYQVLYIPEKTFNDLKNINLLKYDFYLPNLNLLIEYDGRQHFKPGYGSTVEKRQNVFVQCQHRDKIKDEWAKANNIPLLRIPYWDYDRIEELIEAFILEHRKLVAEM